MMRQLGMWLLAAVVVILIQNFATGSEIDADPVKASLVLPSDAVVAAQPFTVGIFLKIDPHWHVYWKSSGDAGLPTRVRWNLPAGWAADELQWPLPEKFIEKGPLTTYGYADSVMLLATITPDKNAKGSATLTAQVDWMVCAETCIPGAAKVSKTVSVTSAAVQNDSSTSSQQLNYWEKMLPDQKKSPVWTVDVTTRPNTDENNAHYVDLHISGPASMEQLDWFPVTAKSRAVKNVKVTKAQGALNVSCILKSFSGPVGAGERLESLLVFRDADGVRRGATIAVNLNPA